MNAIAVSTVSMATKGISDICDSLSRIVDSNNWYATEITACEYFLKTCRNRIELDKKNKKQVIDAYCAQASMVIKSKRFTSSQKKDIYIALMDQLAQI